MEYRPRIESRPVERAALGFLLEAPMHGYELRERIRRELGGVWRVASSRLYSVLHRMSDLGWIEPSIEGREARPARTVYRATPRGERAFWEWIEAPVRLRDVRIEFLAKVFFLQRLAPDRLPALFAAQRAALVRRLDRMPGRLEPGCGDRSFGALVDSYRRGVLEHAIDWLDAHRPAIEERKEEV